jgi:hypothetical protein
LWTDLLGLLKESLSTDPAFQVQIEMAPSEAIDFCAGIDQLHCHFSERQGVRLGSHVNQRHDWMWADPMRAQASMR